MAAKALPETAYLRECFDYDSETGVLTWKPRPPEHFTNDGRWRRWVTCWAGKPAGNKRADGHTSVIVNFQRYQLHRLIWKLMTGYDPPATIDHINGDPTDNRWGNLREATSQEQCFNRVAGKLGRSLPKGVYLRGKRYVAQSCLDGRAVYLGTHDTLEAARSAYLAYVRAAHGEFFRKP